MVFVLDNYDSFTYNLVQYLGELGAEVVVRRNDEVTPEEVEAMKPERILLSPGPCTPGEAGELDLRGWVRNTEEGDVEVVAAGKAAALDELRSSLKRGPRGSRVDRVVEHALNDSEAQNLDSFRIDGAW